MSHSQKLEKKKPGVQEVLDIILNPQKDGIAQRREGKRIRPVFKIYKVILLA